jgi:hypothetical protein
MPKKEFYLSGIFLVLVTYLANFLKINQFSFYSDDWGYLRWVFYGDFSMAALLHDIGLYSDARPIQYTLNFLLGVIINTWGTLTSAYLFLFALTAASILATWWALTWRFSNALALTAAAILAMSPLVSIRPFLNGVGSPFVLLFLMVASILYVSRLRILAYLVSILIILCYELVFPLFALMPILLKPIRTRRDVWHWIGHVAVCVVMLGIDAVYKHYYGESRLGVALSGHGALDIVVGLVNCAFSSLLQGFIGSVDVSLWLGKIEANPDTWLWSAGGFATFFYLLHRLGSVDLTPRHAATPVTLQSIAVLIAMALAGYALVYFVEPHGAYTVLDRSSRFHSAANLPLSILAAMAIIGALNATGRLRLHHAIAALGAAYLALLFGFSMTHQDEFVAQAAVQRAIVMQLIKDHPTMDLHATFILRIPLLDVLHSPAIDHDDGHGYYTLLPALFYFGITTGLPDGPAIRKVYDDSWPSRLTLGQHGQLDWPIGTYPAFSEHVGHIWYYAMAPDGTLTPLTEPVLVGERNILHDGEDPIEGTVDVRTLPRRKLFDLIMGPDAQSFGAALRQAGSNAAASAP